MIELDLRLEPDQVARLQATDDEAWFTRIRFANALSPAHPQFEWLERNNLLKQRMLSDWIARVVPGRTVLDAFSANGAFAFAAWREGAQAVTGIDLDPGRVEAARLVASFLGEEEPDTHLHFEVLDVYDVAQRFEDPFDVVLALGGLYHVPDPAFVLRRLAALCGSWLIVQTSHILPLPGNWARFRVRRRDRTGEGLTSMRAGQGVWYYSRACFRELLADAGLEVVDERTVYRRGRPGYPWYAALTRPR